MLNFSTKKTSLGLDISDKKLKLVQLKLAKNKIKIQALNKIEMPAGVIIEGEIKNKEALINHIKKLVDKPSFGSITTNEVVACLPSTKTFVKLIKIEKGPNHLDKIIETEIEKHIPYQSKEVYFDWQLISESANDYQVLIGASPKTTVNQYLEAFKRANLDIAALEIEACSICRSLLPEENKKNLGQSSKNYCIIDIGANRSNLMIYAKKTIVLALSIPISGQEITNKISKTLEIDEEQAEKAKIICGLDKTQAHGIISDILSEMIVDLISKIENTINFYEAHYPNFGKIDEILLTGGGSNIRNLYNIISEKTSYQTIEADSFTNIDENQNIKDESFIEKHNLNLKDIAKIKDNNKVTIKQNASRTFSTAIGLALRNFLIN